MTYCILPHGEQTHLLSAYMNELSDGIRCYRCFHHCHTQGCACASTLVDRHTLQ